MAEECLIEMQPFIGPLNRADNDLQLQAPPPLQILPAANPVQAAAPIEANDPWRKTPGCLGKWILVHNPQANIIALNLWYAVGIIGWVVMFEAMVSHLAYEKAEALGKEYREIDIKELDGRDFKFSCITLFTIALAYIVVGFFLCRIPTFQFRYKLFSILFRTVMDFSTTFSVYFVVKNVGTNTMAICWFYAGAALFFLSVFKIVVRTYDFIISIVLIEIALNLLLDVEDGKDDFYMKFVAVCLLIFGMRSLIEQKNWKDSLRDRYEGPHDE